MRVNVTMGVERQVHAGERGFEQVIEFLFRPKCARRSFVAHLNEVADGEVRERVGIFFSPIYANRLLVFTGAGSAIHPL